MNNLPEKPEGQGSPSVPARLSNRDFELVIRRAAELQARDVEGPDSDGIDEAEVLRIGRELGLTTQHLHHALTEVKGAGNDESGIFTSLFGPATIRVGRTIPGECPRIASVLEQYLVGKEYLSVLRRLPDRVLLTRSAGAGAAVGRAMSKAFSRTPPLAVVNLEMAIRPLEEGFTYVSLATSLQGQRTGTALTTFLGGGSASGVVAAILGIAVAPLAALVGVPLLAGVVYGGKVYYSSAVHTARIQMESLLDRLEHGELTQQPVQGFRGMGKALKP